MGTFGRRISDFGTAPLGRGNRTRMKIGTSTKLLLFDEHKKNEYSRKKPTRETMVNTYTALDCKFVEQLLSVEKKCWFLKSTRDFHRGALFSRLTLKSKIVDWKRYIPFADLKHLECRRLSLCFHRDVEPRNCDKMSPKLKLSNRVSFHQQNSAVIF